MKKVITKYLSNIPGWRTNRHLIVIESDDWGSIRMPSIEVYNGLLEAGIDLASDEGFRFNKFDSLATYEDLTSLFEVLSSVKDSTDRYAVMTPISLVANPDFERIYRSDFTEYFYEPFTETLKKYNGCAESFQLWLDGINMRLFVPQFHGREHLNVKVWMRTLQKGHEKARRAFDYNMWGISTATDPEIKIEFQAAFDFFELSDIEYQEEVIHSGLNLFEKIFGYRAQYFVPPNGPFSSKLEELCSKASLKYLSCSKIQYEPMGQGNSRLKLHWLGQKTRSGLTCLTRNCYFEPSQVGQDWVDSCLSDISLAFKLHKPAVISSHRVNYIGALYRDNRTNGLTQLHMLLRKIKRAWPDAEFVTSAELGEIISDD